ncbi:MAG: ABC transporter ATP-binding protein [Mesotoga infera]
MLELINLTKVFKTGAFSSGRFKAVNNVSFKIERGEVTSLIGESGSGKSTIGKMILRLLTITSGEIKLDERNISTIKGAELRQYYKKVQGVFQDPFSSYNPIFKVDRVFENLHDVFFKESRQSEWIDKVDSALKKVGLDSEQVLGKYPHQLSGGQLQRILISRALLLDVSFLVADELISMLDASTRIDILNLLADLKKGGLSILFITHDLSLGYYLSEKAVILYRGHVVEMGSTNRVFLNPIHHYTRRLISSVPRLDRKWKDIDSLQKNEKHSLKCFDPAEDGELEMVEVEKDHYVAVKRR